jgi:hypothetical protein
MLDTDQFRKDDGLNQENGWVMVAAWMKPKRSSVLVTSRFWQSDVDSRARRSLSMLWLLEHGFAGVVDDELSELGSDLFCVCLQLS